MLYIYTCSFFRSKQSRSGKPLLCEPLKNKEIRNKQTNNQTNLSDSNKRKLKLETSLRSKQTVALIFFLTGPKWEMPFATENIGAAVVVD